MRTAQHVSEVAEALSSGEQACARLCGTRGQLQMVDKVPNAEQVPHMVSKVAHVVSTRKDGEQLLAAAIGAPALGDRHGRGLLAPSEEHR